MDSNLPPFVNQMLTPAFYEHVVQLPIQLIQTHISYVFLTGDYAYKVKKAVAFGFLDFTTLESRKTYCDEELQLNRRLSPALYLDVISIGQDGDRYILGAQPAVEYAVKMRQFPQSSLLSHRFRDKCLHLEDLASLARQVATFHQQAKINPDIQSYGEVEVVQSIHASNYQISEAFLDWTQPQFQYETTKAYTMQFFQDHEDWIQQRRAHVKDCHGDLHLNNVCFYEQKIQIFDCIEFNQEFRYIDSLYDAAFMVMDLAFQGRSDFSSYFLNIYLEETGDYLGARLLPLYLLMRAYIRGNVCSMALNDPAIAPERRQELEQQAIAYYKLAWTYTQPTEGPMALT